MLCNTTLARMVVQALADGTGSHTKMGTWAVDEREAELCELIADQDERWDESMAGKEQWINIPAQPPGLFRSGTSQSSCCPFIDVANEYCNYCKTSWWPQ